MFGIFRSKKADVLSHWYALLPGFSTLSKEFYAAVEQELKKREVPGLTLSREEFAEGGVLSDKREYLRMTRERLVFDVCAAPFGTAYFFSCRFAEIPLTAKLWQLVVMLLFTIVLFGLSWYFLGVIIGSAAIIALLIALVYFLRNAVALGLKDIDAWLIKSPLGLLYEAWFRKESYYRVDTRLMYLDTVNAVVKAKVEETTGAKGVNLIRYNERNPVIGELYKPTTVTPSKAPTP